MNYIDMIKKYQVHTEDTGSSAVQIILLSQQINDLSKHLKKHGKDNSSRVGLLKMIGRRRRLLTYLDKENPEIYKKIISDLKLRK